MRKAFTTSIEESIQNNFKSICAKNGLPMNTVIELFMKAYSENRFKLEIEYESKIEDKK
jgi:hypothetical protein